MNSLRAFLLRSLPQRRPPSLNRLVLAGRLRAIGLSPTIPLALGHWHYVGDTTQGHRPNSTKASQPNDKKKPTGKGKKPRLTKEEQEERRKKQEEVVRNFNEFIGGRKLKDWKRLCDTIGLEGEFKSIQSCREAIETVLVNIYDVLEADRTIQAGGKARPQRFPTPQALSKYTVEHKKIYPRENVIKSEPEGALLKHISDPELEEKLQREREERLRKKKEAKLKKKEDTKLNREKEEKQTETGST